MYQIINSISLLSLLKKDNDNGNSLIFQFYNEISITQPLKQKLCLVNNHVFLKK